MNRKERRKQAASGDAPALFSEGTLCLQDGRPAEALALFDRALAKTPDFAAALNHKGIALRQLGRPREGLAAFRASTEAAPNAASGWCNLGNCHRALEQFAEAETALRKAIALDPRLAAAQVNLADVLRAVGRLGEAEAAARAALALDPGNLDATNNLGNALRAAGRVEEALACYRRVAEKRPEAMLFNNMANALRDLGRIEEAVATYRQAIALDPKQADIHTSLIFALDFDPRESTQTQQAERDRWWERHGAPLAAEIKAHANLPDPERRLRIGYVTAHFRRQSSASAFGPVILGHDPARFEVACYSGTVQADEITALFKKKATIWRDTMGMSDAALAEAIRADGIDILVDLAGHMVGHRLLVFARKPAPIQVTAWGQATGTGLRTMDYLLSDPVSLPYAERPFLAEFVADLPASLGYAPPAGLPEVAPPPALATGHVTFGCFNRAGKVTARCLDLWARALARIPGSRLLLKDGAWQAEANRNRVLEAMAAAGVAAERVLFKGYSAQVQHLATYAEVDIAFDPFPQSGGITTLEALWMGVPVVTLKGKTIASRGPAAILASLGLTAWVAESEADYIDIAAEAAAKPEGLASMRAGLRPHFAASPIGNPRLYRAAVEAQYRAMWRRWCAHRAGA
ncbi:MAG: tetratricopeptide repeat protein [Alphaproteobacteria bacterium]|nr:tetratricopeptide repeat protein [Alphaproteobacteria bacterium]